MTYRLESEITVHRPLEEVFDFFADATNLESITPPELHFEILPPLPNEITAGTHIRYRMSLFGIPFRWLTEISVWEERIRFVDRQLKGPFKLWVHEHRFESLGPTETRVKDLVTYSLPLEPIGRLAHPIVRQRLNRIFAYRSERVPELLSPRR